MSIVIPAKDIYEIDNQKIVDNEVYNIEVAVVNPQKNNEYNVVVFNDTYSASIERQESVENNNLAYLIGKNGNDAIGHFCYVEYNNHMYTNVIALIEKTANNQKIQNLILGDNLRGNHNVETTITGRTKKGTVTSTGWEADISFDGVKYYIRNVTKNPFVYSEDEWGELQVYNIVSPLSHLKYFDSVIGQFTVEAREDAIDGNLSTVSANEITLNGKEYYELNLKILTSVRTVEFDSYNTAVNNPQKITIPVSTDSIVGSTSYTEYRAENIEINVYGNVIKFDLQEETIKIGDGKHVHSFSGNELMQISNIPTVEETYKKIVKDWGKGKEISVLRCAIDDYYTNDKTKRLAISKSGVVGVSMPMTFHIGDIVIPYIRDTKGEDIPMSIDKEGEPKEFYVIEKNIIYEGAPYQEITIQELQNPIIFLQSELSSTSDTAMIETHVIRGDINIGNTLQYKEETAYVSEFEEDHFTLRVSMNGEFYKKIGKQITVKKIKQ